jgi:hypothetical protein
MPLWQRGGIALILLGLPYALAYREGIQANLPNQGTWRIAYFPTGLLIYIFAAAPWIWRTEKDVIAGLQRLACTERNTDEVVAHRTWWRSSLGDWIAFAAGLLVGALLFFSFPFPEMRHWAVRYWLLTHLILYGALAWLIYAAMGSARFTALLHRFALHRDPFDLAPFEPVGRQGLILALIFVGAITLSLLLLYTPTMFSDWQGIVVYSFLVIVTVSIFFTVMWPAHRVLLAVKQQKLAGIERLIGQTFCRLETLAANGADTQPVATEVQAWLTLEQRVKQLRTWPYDTEMLRTLFLSVLAPLFAAIARVVGIYLTEGHF